MLNQWQREIPGVGDAYKVSTDMLRGVALLQVTNDGRYWQYLPEDKLPVVPEQRLETLFEIQEQWTRRARKVFAYVNENYDVAGLCREFPDRLQSIKEGEGERLPK